MVSSTFTRIHVDTERKLTDMVAHFRDLPRFAFDTETRSADYDKDTNGALKKLTMRCDLASFATPDRYAYVVPLGMVTMPCIPENEFFSAVKPVMEDNEIVHDAWNFSYDCHLYANYGVWVQNFRDLMVAGWLLDNSKGNGLKERCFDVGMELHKYDFKAYWNARHFIQTGMLTAGGKKIKPVSHGDLSAIELGYTQYASEDAEATLLLGDLYTDEFEKEEKLKELFYKLRNPAIRTLFLMERRGIPVNRPYLEEIAAYTKTEIDKAEIVCYQIAGKPFNIGSTKEVGQLLYEELGCPVTKATKKGANSTDAQALGNLTIRGYPIAQAILNWRSKSKMYGTYVGPESSFTGAIYEWGHIHPSFNGAGTETGRLSSSQPNAQNIPTDSANDPFPIRRAVVPKKGRILIGGDFSQIELRIMAHLSADPEMCKEYQKDIELWKALNERRSTTGLPKSDIHQTTATACQCTRKTAKGVNFGNLYGIGEVKLGEFLTGAHLDDCIAAGKTFDPLRDTVTSELARDFQQRFFAKFRGIKAYQQRVSERAMRQGYIETRYGQKRRLPDVYSTERWMQMAAQRQAVNTTVQGHVGELMLLIMNRIERSEDLRKMNFHMFLQVHDEILGDGPERHADDIAYELTKLFQNPAPSTEAYPYSGYRVPLVFEAKKGFTWNEVH